MSFTLLGTVNVGLTWQTVGTFVQASHILVEQDYLYQSSNRLFVAVYHVDPNDSNAPVISANFIDIFPDKDYAFLIDCQNNVGNLANYTHRKIAIRQYYLKQVVNENWTATLSYLV